MRRWAFVGAVTMVVAVLLAGSALAGGGGGGGGLLLFGGPVGRNVQSQRSASAFAQGPTGFTFVTTFVTAGVLTFKAKGSAEPPTSMVGTELNLSVASSDAFGFGCWVIPDAMFVLNSDLSATLHFRSDAAGVTPCPGFGIANGLSGIVPLGGGGGDQFGFSGPIAVDLTWQAKSQIYASRNTVNGSCGPFSVESQGTFSDALGATATGNISATLVEPPGAPPLVLNTSIASQFADASAMNEATVVNGPTPGSCGPFGG